MNCAQLLNITILSLKSQKLGFSTEVFNLIWLLMSCVPRESSFISIHFFVLNFLIFWYSNLRSLIIFCLFAWDIYLSLGISLLLSIFSVSFITISILFYGEIIKTFVIILAVLLLTRSPVASAGFWIVFSEAVLSASYGGLFSMIRKVFAVFTAYIFTYILSQYFCS